MIYPKRRCSISHPDTVNLAHTPVKACSLWLNAAEQMNRDTAGLNLLHGLIIKHLRDDVLTKLSPSPTA